MSSNPNARRVLRKERVHVSDNPFQVPVSVDAAKTPQLHIERDDYGISAIEIVCACGCAMKLVCEYE